MKNTFPKILFHLLLIIFYVFLAHPSILAEEYVILLGQVVDKSHHPVGGAVMTISGDELNADQILISDEAGFFKLCGLPFGRYTLQAQANGYKALTRKIHLGESSSELYLLIALAKQDNHDTFSNRLYIFDFGRYATQTTIDEAQIQKLPSGNSVWSLIENQDLSATTNRIDVGGLWLGIPALLSSRGSCSWTQNTYLLQGLNVTDPFWTGLPLFYPDIYSLKFIQNSNASHPVQDFHPGATLNLVPKEGTLQYHGGMSFFYIDKDLGTSNITPALKKEGIEESNNFNYLADSHFYFSGPLIRQKLFFFTSWSAGYVSRDLADYEPEDRSAVYSGLVNLKYILSQNILRFFWTGQFISHPSFGAERNIPFLSTSKQKNFFNIFQVILDSKPRETHAYRAGLSLSQGNMRSDIQDNVRGQHGVEIFQNIPSGPAPFAGQDSRQNLVLFYKAKRLFTSLHQVHHSLEYGFQLQSSSSSSKEEILDNVHLHFFDGRPVEVVLFNSPLHHREFSFNLNLFVQETITLSNLFSAYLGLNLGYSLGWTPDFDSNPNFSSLWNDIQREKNEIRWLNLSPRLGLLFPLWQKKTSYIKISLARYYFTLPHNYLIYGNSNTLGGLAYEWQDSNLDGLYQKGEEKNLLRREGPFFAKIDPGLKRPSTDELALSFVHSLGSNWFFTLTGYIRKTRNLVETVNIGVPFTDYDPVFFYDEGDDRIPGTPDDLYLTVYDQKKETLGHDFYLLTNPDSQKRISRYQGLDLTLVKKLNSRFIFFLSLTATHAEGTTSPGNTEWENDDGIVGSLDDNPNTLLNARGRPMFDRAYTARLGFSLQAPGGIGIGFLAKYYDGQPFARKIIVQGLNQGPFYIQAHPRGISRYEFNMTVDIRLEKAIVLKKGTLRLLLDGFNIFNQHLATEESEWTGPEFPLRSATEIQSPRVFRIGLNYKF